MKATRLEAFSDGVIAIIITIMVLELKAPQDIGVGGLRRVLPVFLSMPDRQLKILREAGAPH